jgi:hypothetical protein
MLKKTIFKLKKTDFKQCKDSKFQKTFSGQTSEHRSNPNQLFFLPSSHFFIFLGAVAYSAKKSPGN